MGCLVRSASRHELPASSLVGRSRVCDLILDAKDVSGQHAMLQWTGSLWEVHDLGSRNGTYVDDYRLVGERMPLRPGAAVRFGRELAAWELVDAGPPRPMAVHLSSGRVRVAEAGYLALPDGEDPASCLLASAADRWVLEQDGEASVIGDRDLIIVRNEPWRVHISIGASGTWEEKSHLRGIADLRLRFSVARNEEYIELVASVGDLNIDLKARAHHYPLLLLARARLADQQAQVEVEQQGWVHQDRLLAMLKMDVSHLNINIHRGRVQLSQAGIVDAPRLVERRTGTRQLRLGVRAVEIVRLSP